MRVTYQSFSGVTPIRVPVTDRTLTVLSLEIEAGRAIERFEQDKDGRWVRYLDAEGPELTLRCCYRLRRAADAPPSAAQLFAGARLITVLSPPTPQTEWPLPPSPH